jgi:cytoskeletal protein CcmA (bactofilin family)
VVQSFASRLLYEREKMLQYFIKGLAALLVVIFVTVFTAVPVLAADLRGGETVTVASGEVIDDDLYIAGTNIVIDGTVNGDIFGVGTTIIINGKVNGSVTFGGQDITINGEIANSARLAGTNIIVNGNIGGDLLAGGTNIDVASIAKIGRDILFGASTVRIDGPIEGYIKGAGSEVTVTNGVRGDIELKVDELTITSSANLQGNLTYISENEAEIQPGAQIAGTTTHKVPEVKEPAGPFAGIGGKVIAYLMTLLAGIVIILISPRRSAAVAASIRRKPWLSLGWGAIILFATPIAAIITLFTVVGVPVGLIGLTLYGIVIYLSQIAVGLFIGYWIIGYFSKVESRGVLVGALALGFTILSLLKLIPYVGFPWLWLATVLFGIGAMSLSPKTLQAEEAARL